MLYNYKLIDETGLKTNVRKGSWFFYEFLTEDEVRAKFENDYDYTYVKEELKEEMACGVEYVLKALIERDFGGRWEIVRR